MSRHSDLHCDVSGAPIALQPVPIVVMITAAIVPGATTDPQFSDLSQFLQKLLFNPDGTPRTGPDHGKLELCAVEFDACFKPDLVRLAPAFEEQETPAQELVRLRAEHAQMKAQLAAVDTAQPG